MLTKHEPFTDQGDFPVPVVRLVEKYDNQTDYEMDQGAIFRTKKGYLGVVVSGCS
jgi:hypothetical protein